VRLDVALNRLCLTRSRSEAKLACEAGAVFVGGRPAKPSQSLAPGDVVLLRFTHRVLEVRVLEVPQKSISKKAAREMYEVLRDERVDADDRSL
jgi:ribosomal 50S subunit-recycling heat shock protein